MNPVFECSLNHKSVRKYKNQPIENEKLKTIIQSAQRAPNASNAQQVSIIAIKDQAHIELNGKFCLGMKHVSSYPVFLVFCADFYLASLAFQKNGKSLDELDKYVNKPNSLILGSQDVGLAMGYATICAESLGLSVCPVGVLCVKFS